MLLLYYCNKYSKVVVCTLQLYDCNTYSKVVVLKHSFALGFAMRRFLLMRIDAHQMRIRYASMRNASDLCGTYGSQVINVF